MPPINTYYDSLRVDDDASDSDQDSTNGSFSEEIASRNDEQTTSDDSEEVQTSNPPPIITSVDPNKSSRGWSQVTKSKKGAQHKAVLDRAQFLQTDRAQFLQTPARFNCRQKDLTDRHLSEELEPEEHYDAKRAIPLDRSHPLHYDKFIPPDPNSFKMRVLTWLRAKVKRYKDRTAIIFFKRLNHEDDGDVLKLFEEIAKSVLFSEIFEGNPTTMQVSSWSNYKTSDPVKTFNITVPVSTPLVEDHGSIAAGLLPEIIQAYAYSKKVDDPKNRWKWHNRGQKTTYYYALKQKYVKEYLRTAGGNGSCAFDIEDKDLLPALPAPCSGELEVGLLTDNSEKPDEEHPQLETGYDMPMNGVVPYRMPLQVGSASRNLKDVHEEYCKRFSAFGDSNVWNIDKTQTMTPEQCEFIVQKVNFMPRQVHFDDYNMFIKRIKSAAPTEQWGKNDDILKNFVDATFQQQYNKKHIIGSDDGKFYFDLNLPDKQGRALYIRLERNGENITTDENTELVPDPLYVFDNVMSEADLPEDLKLDRPPRPGWAEDDWQDLFFDPNIPLHLSTDHIFSDNRDRITQAFSRELGDAEAERWFTSALLAIKGSIRYNYRIAVPQYYDQAIQFLLPLHYGHKVKLVAVARPNRENAKLVNYQITTILTPDWAYNNARVICSIESNWLQGALVKEFIEDRVEEHPSQPTDSKLRVK